MAGSHRRGCARQRPRSGARRTRPLGNGNHARRVRSRAQIAKVSMTIKLVALLFVLGFSAAAAAQTPKAAAQARKALPQARQPGDIETDPIRCFWKTDRSSIIVGERFTLVLTCGIIDTEKIKAVPDFNQLEPSTIGVLPFEVVKGVRHEDVKAAPWRYIQYEYTVRTIAERLFDKDLNIPPVQITSHIQSSVGA